MIRSGRDRNSAAAPSAGGARMMKGETQSNRGPP
jgi:hypothetical protein